jgi:DNA-binding SARP family transcriptional activator/CheY-like chemotaxis protein
MSSQAPHAGTSALAPRYGETVQLRLLGGLELVVDGESTPIGGRKERLLLALLALNAGRDVDQARMIDALWGDDPPRTAVKSLHSHIWRLRTHVAAGGSGIEILTQPSGYRLTVARGDVDIHVVATLVEQARRDAAAGALREAVAGYDEALTLWTGRSLGALADEPCLVGEAVRLEELRAAVSEERIEALLGLGQHATVIGTLESLCADHPFRERLVALRMLALYRCARQSEALAVFQYLRHQLRDELGLEPSPVLSELEHSILAQDRDLDWPGNTGTESAPPAVAAPAGDALRVLLVDDHPVWRQAVRVLLERDGNTVVIAEVDDGEAAVAAVASHTPALVLMDLHLPGIGGVEATRRIVEASPDTRVLVLSASEDEDDVKAALRAGAHGYVLKSGSARDVVDAVRRVVAGEPVFSPGLASVVLSELRRPGAV